jgi:hypothetical protein
MLRSQAALCESTGSLEMSVFQMLFAGKIGQPASSPDGPLPAPGRGAFGGTAAPAAAPAQAAMMITGARRSSGRM